MSDLLDRFVVDGIVESCEGNGPAWFVRCGWWSRGKLRGAALSSVDLEPWDIFRAPFHRGYVYEDVPHTGEWCDPQWPVLRFVLEPHVGAEPASWLELG
jgi:hypothetical protein